MRTDFIFTIVKALFEFKQNNFLIRDIKLHNIHMHGPYAQFKNLAHITRFWL